MIGTGSNVDRVARIGENPYEIALFIAMVMAANVNFIFHFRFSRWLPSPQ